MIAFGGVIDMTTRINIEVKKGLWKQIKVRAAMRGKTLIEVLNDALVLYLKTKVDDK